MANLEHLKILRQGVEAWNEWRNENINLFPDLSGINLSSTNFSRADFSKVNFSSANLFSSNFYSANLQSANLQSANLRSANFSSADLSFADLRDTDISFADLCCANLSKADLSNASFSNHANLHSANLHAANLSSIYLNSADLSNADLSNADLSNADLSKTNLRKASLRDSNLSGCNLGQANLSYARLFDANLMSANLSEAIANNADFSGANLSDAILKNVDFNHADLSYADLWGAQLKNANLSHTNLEASQVLRADFTGVILTGACIADWQINNSTKLEQVTCDYIFRAIVKGNFSRRLPVNLNKVFSPGEFALLANVRASALETIDLTFTQGFKWQFFFDSLQEVRAENPNTGIFLQGVEERDGQYVVRLRIETDKTGDARTILEAKIETTTKELVETRRQLHEAHGEIKALDRRLDRRDRSLEEALRMATDQGPKYNLQGAQFAGGFAETVQGNQIGGVINNYGQKTEDIIRLLTSLREQAQVLPTEHKEEALDLLDDIEIDLKKPKPNTSRMGRKLKRFAEIATTIGILTAGAVTFSGNLNEVVGGLCHRFGHLWPSPG